MTMIAMAMERAAANWWTFVVRGVIALALAVFAFAAPATMAGALSLILAAFFLVGGLLALVAGVSFTGVDRWWALILLGAVQIWLGFVMFSTPGAAPLTLAFLVSIWAISTGLLETTTAIALRNSVGGAIWWIFAGILTIALGAFIVFRPDLGLFWLVFSIGIYAALAGVSLIVLGFRLRGTVPPTNQNTP